MKIRIVAHLKKRKRILSSHKKKAGYAEYKQLLKELLPYEEILKNSDSGSPAGVPSEILEKWETASGYESSLEEYMETDWPSSDGDGPQFFETFCNAGRISEALGSTEDIDDRLVEMGEEDGEYILGMLDDCCGGSEDSEDN